MEKLDKYVINQGVIEYILKGQTIAKRGKSMKKKLMIIGVGTILLVALFLKNIMDKKTSDRQATTVNLIENQNGITGEGITRAEAFRLVSYLYYTDEDRKKLKCDEKLLDVANDQWYYEYIIAMYSAGFENQADSVEGKYYMRPMDQLNEYEADLLFAQIADSYGLLLKEIYVRADVDCSEKATNVYLNRGEFINLYEAVLEMLQSERAMVKVDELYILAVEEGNQVKTQKGEFYGAELFYLQSDEFGQEPYVIESQKITDISEACELENQQAGGKKSDEMENQQAAGKSSDELGSQQVTQKESGKPSRDDWVKHEDITVADATQKDISDYLDCKLEVMVSEKRILYVRKVIEEETIFPNVYIVHGEKNQLTVYVEGVTKTFTLSAPLQQPMDSLVGNITCKNAKVTGISIKPDSVSDKVLTANQEYIELAKYGKVEFDENFKIYKVYGELSMETANAILVGYENTKFVLQDHRISAALITEPVVAANIRVMIKTDGYQSLFHEKVVVTCKEPFTVRFGEKKKSYKAGKKVTIKPDSKILKEGRLCIAADDQETPIQILSIARAQGNPYYRGSIEVAATDYGLIVINDVLMEEYLYAVLPSEMPVSYGLEALKVQAVCARSYAYQQLLGNTYREYGAHVDDSSNYQVYNNLAETKESMKAVKETYGQVITYEGNVITAYYFSTSCGHTSSMSDVWTGEEHSEYLIGSLQKLDGDTQIASSRDSGIDEDSKSDIESLEAMAIMNQDHIEADFSEEAKFREFILGADKDMLESSFAWYRWNVELSLDTITHNVNHSLYSRYIANPSLILTRREQDGTIEYVAEPVRTIGDVIGVEVKERKSSGIVTAILLHGTKETILVKTEYNIRTMLAPSDEKVIRQDQSKVDGLSLLPSAFIILNQKDSTLTIHGGGYGHGVGMSQNGVKALTDLGYKYNEVTAYYYKGTKIKNIYT